MPLGLGLGLGLGVSVVSVGGAVLAVRDAVETPLDVPVNINVLANDTALPSATVSVTAQGGNGSAAVQGDRSITYTPAISFSGVDTFTYMLTDGSNTSTANVDVFVDVDGFADGDGTLWPALDSDTSKWGAADSA